MISSNSISAPQLRNGRSLLADELASLEDLYIVLTAPTLEREEILTRGETDITLRGRILIHTVVGEEPQTE